MIVKSCANLMALFHVGLAVASCALLLYFFSRRNCSCGESFVKSGGQTFFSLKATFGKSSCDLDPCAARLSSVGSIVAFVRTGSSELAFTNQGAKFDVFRNHRRLRAPVASVAHAPQNAPHSSRIGSTIWLHRLPILGSKVLPLTNPFATPRIAPLPETQRFGLRQR